MVLEPGSTVERYTVEAFLGRGAMAEVYRVRHRTLKTTHALKVLTLASPTIRDRLIQEGQVQAQIRHANVLSVSDVLDVGGAPGLLMELVEGPTLDEYIREHAPDPVTAELLFAGVLAGVAAAHEHGLVHRDLKPANVLVASTARGPVPKVADFGLAKVLAEVEGGGMQRTRSGSALGTPSYMAPEQIRDAKHVDHRADIFSLGCILYEVMTGRGPFDGDDLLTVFNKVAAGVYAPVPHLPQRIQQAIAGALITDRNLRIPDCATLGAVLAGTRQGWSAAVPAAGAAPGSAVAAAPPEGLAAGGAGRSTWIGDDESGLESLASGRPPIPPPAPTLAPSQTYLGEPMDSAISLDAPRVPESEPARALAPPPPTGGKSPALRGWWVGAIAAAVLATIAAVNWQRGPSTLPSPPGDAAGASELPAAEPAPPAAAPAAGAVQLPAAVDVTPPGEAAQAPPPAVPAAAKPAPRTPASAPDASSVAAPAVGTLKVSSNWAGTVIVDGKDLGVGFKSVEVPTGRHDVVIRLADGRHVQRTVTVASGAPTRFCWDFDEEDECSD